MPGKNIVLCSDGTGNSASKAFGTNVLRIYNAIDRHGHLRDPALKPQLAFYDDGVGTESFLPLQLLSGAVGLGLNQNIRDLYEALVRVYEPGDDIYLFGFSRGAFTVRSLAGMICRCGIVDAGRGGEDPMAIKRLVGEAFDTYRRQHKRREPQLAADFKARHSHAETRIRCIGVWDTVGAIGVPVDELRRLLDLVLRISFHSCDLLPEVEYGFHALAIDDERQTFAPVMWDERKSPHPPGRIEQVWFAGAHSNVGGGYPKQGLAQVSLHWMMSKVSAPELGLRFNSGALEQAFQAANVHDKLYDSRAGLAGYYRYKPRDLCAITERYCVGTTKLHASVFERIATGIEDYAPVNLPGEFNVVSEDAVHGRASDYALNLGAEERAQLMKLRTNVRNSIRARRLLHGTFVGVSALFASGALALALRPPEPVATHDVEPYVRALLPDVCSRLALPLLEYVIEHPSRLLVLLLTLCVMLWARGPLRRATRRPFLEFWAPLRAFHRGHEVARRPAAQSLDARRVLPAAE
jgi:hypothetical protein